MPSLYSAGVHIRLGTLPLADSITPKVVRKKGDVARQQAEVVEQRLRGSEFLDEECVRFPGDDEAFAVNWLAGAPFLQVLTADAFEVKKELEDLEPGRRNPLRSTRSLSIGDTGKEKKPDSVLRKYESLRSAMRTHLNTPSATVDLPLHRLTPTSDRSIRDNELIPKALALHVTLTKKSFYDSIADNSPQSAKIDVFFNGQLSSSVFVQSKSSGLDHIFAGNRVDYLVERPWVILPPGQDVDGSLRRIEKATSVQERWEQISHALLNEARECGVNETGGQPPSAQFLQELATMQMPDDVNKMQKPGGRRFGVIDVVVTVGTGTKVNNGTSYLRQPTRLVDESYSYEIVPELVVGEEIPKVQQQANTGKGRGLEEGWVVFDDQDTKGKPSPDNPLLSTTPTVKSSDARPSWNLKTPPRSQDSTTSTGNPPLQRVLSVICPNEPAPSPKSNTDVDLPSDTLGMSRHRKRSFCELDASVSDEHTGTEEHTKLPHVLRLYPSAHAPTTAPRKPQPLGHLDPEFNLSQLGRYTHTNSYQLPFAGMMVGLGTTGMSSLSSCESPAFTSAHGEPSGKPMLPSINPAYSSPMQNTERLDTPFVSSPSAAPILSPIQDHRVAFGPANTASYHLEAPPNNTAASPGVSIRGSYGLPESAYRSFPLFQSNPQSHELSPSFPIRSFMHPLDRPKQPPPPIGLFKLTRKSKTAPQINSSLVNTTQSRSNILVRRVRITGLNGAPIIDHQWEIPQRATIADRSRGQNNSSTRSGSSTTSQQEPLGLVECVKSSTESQRQRKTILPPMGSLGSIILRSSENKVSAPDVLDLVKMYQRKPSTRIFGVQGPKANTFVFDNPEELLRKGKRLKPHYGSMPTMKMDAMTARGIAPPVEVVGIQAVDNVARSGEHDTNSSSPLSSPPSSPNVGAANERRSMQKAAILSMPTPAPPTSAPPIQSLLSPLPTPDISNKASLTNLLPGKKRAHHSMTSKAGPRARPSHSLDRLSATNNPPLNHDCVIQYAISDKDGGALRQVKCERQGWFQEESVVVGVRFFVPG